MSEPKWTPGPWNATEIPYGFWIEAEKEWIATVHLQDESTNATARLIAAAPELYEALERCAAVCAGQDMTKNGLIDALEAARAALAKVRGES